MKYTLKQLLSMILMLTISFFVLASCTGCVSTPEPWRADMQTPDGKVAGVVRQTAYMHKQYLPIISNNASVIRAEDAEEWEAIRRRMSDKQARDHAGK